jgi:hypothetical protein
MCAGLWGIYYSPLYSLYYHFFCSSSASFSSFLGSFSSILKDKVRFLHLLVILFLLDSRDFRDCAFSSLYLVTHIFGFSIHAQQDFCVNKSDSAIYPIYFLLLSDKIPRVH